MSNNKNRTNDYAYFPNMNPRKDLYKAERVLIKRPTEEKDSRLKEFKIKQMLENYKPKV